MKKVKISRVISMVLIIALALLAMTACGASQETSQKSTEQAKAVEPAKAQVKELALIPPAMVSPYYAGVIKGAKPVAEKLGYKLTVLSPDKESDFAGQVKIAEDMITKNVAGIGLCSINDDAIGSAVKKANAAKIPVVFFNSSLKELSAGDIYTYIGFVEKTGVENLTEYFNKITSGKATVGIIEGLPSTYTTARKGGFENKIKEYPGIKVVASQPGDWEREKAMNVATNMLQAHPEITAFFACCDEMALGAAQAVKAAGKKGITIVSVDGNPNALEAIMKDEMQATLGVNPVLTGQITIEQLDKAIKGVPAEKKILEIDTVVISKDNAEKFMDKK